MNSSIEHKRHSLAHLLAAAVLELYPDAKPTIGPAVEDGFYYDISFEKALSEKDLPSIEKKMKEILGTWSTFEKSVVDAAEALKQFSSNEFKCELINELSHKGEEITLYTSGTFTDLCRGGHVAHMNEISPNTFLLDRIAGAYLRGDEKNPMLTRIYGLAFDTKEELTAYLVQKEEARKRDHRKIAQEMKLYTLSPLIGSGLPLLQPNGMIIRKEIEDYLWELHKDKGYSRVWTPHIAKSDLYKTSGHWDKFGDELFKVHGQYEDFCMKPMNCPHHMQIFSDNQFSYRDLPIRYFEPATVYRDEKPGQLSGLTRVRSITQDDGHLFCTLEQVEQEAITVASIIKEFYTTLGMMDGYWVSLSVRGDDKSKYLGEDSQWDKAEELLKNAAEKAQLNYKVVEGEAAFYGPKLDFMFKDAIGRECQLGTIQCDFNLPERFDLSFTNSKGEKERPVVIHRAISGSLERFMGIAIEHFAGLFPVWLSPIQIYILTISEAHKNYAMDVVHALRKSGIRAVIDDRNESIGKKIRESFVSKVPYICVIGDAEVESKQLAIKGRNNFSKIASHLDSIIEFIQDKIQTRSLTLE